MSEDAEPAAARPLRRAFDKRYREMRLSPERAKRQWLITHLALSLLGQKDRAMSFLNTHNETLAARPLDLAIENADGYAAVEAAIRLLAQPHVGARQ